MVSDVDNLCVWEALSRCARAASSAELARHLQYTTVHVQRCLTALLAARLVKRVPARGRQRVVRWRVTKPSISIFYREGDAADEAARVGILRSIDIGRDSQVRECIKPSTERIPGQDADIVVKFQGRLQREEVNELFARIMGIVRWLDSRAQSSASAVRSKSGADPIDCNYDLRIALEPLHAGVKPLAMVKVLSLRNQPYWQSTLAPARVTRLSARERDIAQRVERGETTQAIASALGVTPNTVKTHLRRLSQKLGVRRRSQVASALARLD